MNKINEKISWKELLVGLGIYLGTDYIIKDYKNYSFLSTLYDVVNTDNTDQKLSEKVKDAIINDVKESNLFNEYGKDYILDSLRKTKVVITDKDFLLENSNGFYIHLPNVIENFKIVNFLTMYKKPNYENIIFIHKESINNNIFESVLTHELYHYVDKLLSNRNEKIFTDYSYLTKEKLELKLNKIIDNDILNIMNKQGFSNDIIGEILNNRDYLTSNKEIFARVNTLRSNLKRDGYIENINQEINEVIIRNYIKYNLLNEKDIIDDIIISLIIFK